MQYSKSTIFQANHNDICGCTSYPRVVCNTAKVRFFKQITTILIVCNQSSSLFAIQQKYDFSSKSQQELNDKIAAFVVCNTAKVRFFKQITTKAFIHCSCRCCLQYSKSTIFQANHNQFIFFYSSFLLFAIQQKYDFSSKSQLTEEQQTKLAVVCNTAKVRFFKQITTWCEHSLLRCGLFAIQQKYDFSSKSQPISVLALMLACCLQYSKSTIFQANHNSSTGGTSGENVVCNTAKVRFFKQITTFQSAMLAAYPLFAIQQKYDFSSKSQPLLTMFSNS